MATLVLTAVGTLVGGPIGGAVGAAIGQSVDQAIFAPKARQGPRLGEMAVQTSSYGTVIPKIFGTMRVAGTVIWSTDLIERRSTTGGGKGGPRTTNYTYAASFAVALSGRPLREVRRIWADGKLLRGAGGDWKGKTGFRLYTGDEDQAPDPLIAAAEGAGQAPAFRGVAYAMFEELELADYGNRIPSLTFEVVAEADAVTLGAIAAELSGGAVAAGVTPALAGFAASGDSVRGAIEDLARIVPLSLVDEEDKLRLREMPGEAVTLPPGDEVVGGSEGREIVRRAAGSVPGEVSLAYYDAARDYQTGLQRATAAGPVAEARTERRAVPAVLSAGAAKALAEGRLDALWAARAHGTVTLAWRQAGVRPGAVVSLAGEAGRWRVERWTLGPMILRLQLVRIAGGMLPAVAATPGRPVSEVDLPHGATVLRAYDLPLGEGSRDTPYVAVLAAGVGAGWRRAALSVSLDDGASWRDIGGTAAPAVIGAAAGVLAAGSAALCDRAANVEVVLRHAGMELLSRDEDALVGGANLALLGGELIQFGRAELMMPGRYRLSGLLRGRRGTEWAARTHVAGEAFALIDAASQILVDAPRGSSLRVMASGVGDTAPAEASVDVSGEALRPPAPVHLTAAPEPGGDLLLRWVRRSRQGWSWSDGADAPLGEESERYRVTLVGPGGARSVEATTPEWRYAAAEQAADGTPVRIEVAQLGTHAVSRAAVLTLT